MAAHRYSFGSKISSIGRPNCFAIRNASGRLGSYLPTSMAYIVCRETPILSPNSDWESLCCSLNSLTLFFNGIFSWRQTAQSAKEIPSKATPKPS